MRSAFQIVTPAVDPNLLTIEQLRGAAGLTAGDTSRDTELTALGQQISADIHSACRIRSDGVNPPTLRLETVRETFRERGCENTLFLSRMFVRDVVSVSEAGTSLVADDTLVDGEAGMLYRIAGTRELNWRLGDVVVEYTTGFGTVPPDLVGIAMDLARLRLSAASVDPLEKSTTIEIPDVETRRVDRWVGAAPGSNSGPVPADIMARLSRYANVVVA